LLSINDCTYKYNEAGIRVAKTSLTENKEFVVEGSKIIQMKDLNDSTRDVFFNYDESNLLVGFTLRGKEYFYTRDVTGNIQNIIDIDGNVLVKYGYDAWGFPTKTNVALTDESTLVMELNPFLYKGYFYDDETSLYYCNSRYYNPEWGRWLNSDDVSYLDPSSVNGLNLNAYCGNNPVNYKQGPVFGGTSITVPAISTGGISNVGGSSGSGMGGSDPSGRGSSTPWWMSTAVGAIPDFILGMKYLAASGMHSKFAYATNTRYMHPIMGGTWRWFGKSSSSFGTVAQGTFKQILTGDARAGFGAIAKSVGGVVGLNALVNFGFNLYENNWQVDSAMLMDTAIDTAIGTGSYFLAVGTMSLATAGLLAAGVSLPGIIVVGGVVVLGIGFEHLIRAISGYWD
ncbi:MAG TPA: RHS repeat-associated core domain-containing protein, partial [Tissierellaceae bacterium]